MDLYNGPGLIVHREDLVDGHTRVTLLQRLASFEDARAYALALFYLALIVRTRIDFVFDDYTYQSVVLRTKDLTDPVRDSLVAAAESVTSRAADVRTQAEIHFAGPFRDRAVPTTVPADLAVFQGAEFIGRDFVEAVTRTLTS